MCRKRLKASGVENASRRSRYKKGWNHTCVPILAQEESEPTEVIAVIEVAIASLSGNRKSKHDDPCSRLDFDAFQHFLARLQGPLVCNPQNSLVFFIYAMTSRHFAKYFSNTSGILWGE